MKCQNCSLDLTDVQVTMNFLSLPAGQDWVEFPVIAGVCVQCGKMDFHLATPQQFARWVESQKA